jgi:hypothetical protein
MLSDPSYADAYAPAYAKPFIAEEHMAHILGRLNGNSISAGDCRLLTLTRDG